MQPCISKCVSNFAAIAGAVLIVVLPTSLAQSPDGASYTAPRTADGQPDLQGTWSNGVLTPLERPAELADKEFLTEEEAIAYEQRIRDSRNADRRNDDASQDVSLAYNNFWWDWGKNIAATRRTSLVIDPPDGRIPALTDAGKARVAALAERRRLHPSDGPEDRTLADRCLLWRSAGPPMLPTAYNNNFQLVQTADYVMILNEMVHEARIIPLDSRPALPSNVRQWLGSSRGRFEGYTLIVETTNFTAKTAFQGASENMRLTERFTRVADDVLLYEFTVDDPEAFTRPWTVQIPARKADGMIYEYACHEGNYAMEGILAGAREEERAAAEAKKGSR
jgi:hypothetical protein